jgi:hypothetical protein
LGGNPEKAWFHSLRGDWKNTYWHKTANQAYHFWFYIAAPFFDGDVFARAAVWYHDPQWKWKKIDFTDVNAAPEDPTGTSIQDFLLGLKGVELGDLLKMDYDSHTDLYDKKYYPYPTIKVDLAA